MSVRCFGSYGSAERDFTSNSSRRLRRRRCSLFRYQSASVNSAKGFFVIIGSMTGRTVFHVDSICWRSQKRNVGPLQAASWLSSSEQNKSYTTAHFKTKNAGTVNKGTRYLLF